MKINTTLKELKNFLLLWSSQTVSALGTAMTSYALVIWVYEQHGTASSVTLLTLCSFLPTILFRFAAGTLADRWNKKRIMLTADACAACGTLLILVFHSLNQLQTWHLYVINVLLSIMDAFQVPASYVATSLLVPPRHYAKAGSLQALSGSVLSILAPALGSVLLVLGGLRLVLWLDLFTFGIAFFTLFCFIRLPCLQKTVPKESRGFWQECTDGFVFLRQHRPLLRLILFFTAINFLAKLGEDGQLAAFVLAKTSGDHQALGMVQAAVSLGVMAGSLLMTWLNPAKRRFAAVYFTCGLIFLFGDTALSLSSTANVWAVSVFCSYLMAAVMNVHLTVLMRESVPVNMQGRVFSARDTLQNISIPFGLLLGGLLVDDLFEPFMSTPSFLQQWLGVFFGTGNGSGISLLFFCTGLAGACLSFAALWKTLRKRSPF